MRWLGGAPAPPSRVLCLIANSSAEGRYGFLPGAEPRHPAVLAERGGSRKGLAPLRFAPALRVRDPPSRSAHVTP